MPRSRTAMLVGFAALVAIPSCSDLRSPIEPDSRTVPEARPQEAMFSARLVPIDPDRFFLISGPEERASGIYRFRVGPDAPPIEPGAYILGEAEAPYLRRVVRAAPEQGAIALETVEAWWPEILRSGTYGHTVDLSPPGPRDARPADGAAGIPIEIGDGSVTDVYINFCTGQGLEDAPDAVRNFQICNRPNDGFCKDVSAANFDIEVCGNITRLELIGQVSFDGTVDVTYEIDAGGFVPPKPPVYSPCSTNPAACGYTGFCVAGTNVVVQVFPLRTQTCTLVRAGSPARIDLPSVENAGIDGDATAVGQLSLIVEAQAKASIDIPIPKAAFSKKLFNKKGGGSSDSIAVMEITAGAFVNVTLRAAGLGATLTGSTDQEHEFFFGWSGDDGWDTSLNTKKFEGDVDLSFTKPDTISVRVGLRRKIELESPIIPGLPGPLALLGGKIALGAGYDQPWDQVTWSRPAGHNWKYDVDRGVAVQAEAKLKLPFGFSAITGIKLDKEFEKDFFVRDEEDYFGKGDVVASVIVTGSDLDPDGYALALSRTNTMAEPVHTGVLTGTVPGPGGDLRFSTLLSTFDELCVKKYAPFSFFTGNASYLDCDLAAEPHTLRVGGLAQNCAVTGANPRVVKPVPDAEVNDTVRITCKALSDSAFAQIRASVTTGGAGTDADGYALEVDGVTAGVVNASGTIVLGGLASGNRNVTLTDVAAHCTVQGPATASVTVAAGDTADVAFHVDCLAASMTGDVRITVATSGDQPDPDGYIVLLDDAPADSVAVNGSVTLSAIVPGSHTIEIGSVSPACVIQQANPRTTLVQAAVTTAEHFDILCSAANAVGEVWVEVTTSSGDPDATYTARAGKAEAAVEANGNILFQGVPAGAVPVRLDGLPRNCRVVESNPTTADVVADQRTVVAFTVQCGQLAVHNLAGDIEVTGLQTNGRGAITAAVPAAARAAQVCWNASLNGAHGPALASGIFAQRFRNCFLTLGIHDEVLQIGVDGAFQGTGTFTRSVSLDQNNDGGMHGSWTMDVTWNGESGSFKGFAAGSIRNGKLELAIAARGTGPFQGMSVELTLKGPLEGPFTYTAVLVPDVW